MQLKFDELNMLNSNEDNEIDSESIYREYYSIMPISDERKELRVQLALAIENMMVNAFAYMNADFLTDEYIDEEYYVSYVERQYRNLIDKYTKNVSEDNYMAMYIATMSTLLIENTIKHQISEYYYSRERAINIAKDESNRAVNYSEEMYCVSSGATSKIWVSVGDNKVRATHKEADGQVVSIYEPFTVGGCELMYPTDISLGASWSEVDGCRCCAEYLNDDGDVVGVDDAYFG